MREKDDDMFDFSEHIFLSEDLTRTEPTVEEYNHQSEAIFEQDSYKKEIETSFILVNALLNILIQKGMIYPHEVNDIVAELHEDYVKQKGEKR